MLFKDTYRKEDESFLEEFLTLLQALAVVQDPSTMTGEVLNIIGRSSLLKCGLLLCSSFQAVPT